MTNGERLEGEAYLKWLGDQTEEVRSEHRKRWASIDTRIPGTDAEADALLYEAQQQAGALHAIEADRNLRFNCATLTGGDPESAERLHRWIVGGGQTPFTGQARARAATIEEVGEFLNRTDLTPPVDVQRKMAEDQLSRAALDQDAFARRTIRGWSINNQPPNEACTAGVATGDDPADWGIQTANAAPPAWIIASVWGSPQTGLKLVTDTLHAVDANQAIGLAFHSNFGGTPLVMIEVTPLPTPAEV